MDYNIPQILRAWFTGAYFRYWNDSIVTYISEILLYGRPTVKPEPEDIYTRTTNLVYNFTIMEVILCFSFFFMFLACLHTVCIKDDNYDEPDTLMDYLYDSINEIESKFPQMEECKED